MKKLLLLGAFVAFGFMSVNAQGVAEPNTTVIVAKDDKPAKSDKKEKKSKKDRKSCGDEKEKSCKSGDKKACCSDKHHEEAPVKKEEQK